MALNQNLNLIFWNACGVQNKLPELIHFSKERNAHAIAVSETLLKSHSKFFIPGYKIFRCVGPRAVLLTVKVELLPTQTFLPDKAQINFR